VNIFAATLGVAILLAGSPALASTDPITLSNVNVLPLTNADDGFGRAFVSVDFQNNSTETATEVTFALEDDGAIVNSFNDVGEFAPGVTISHAFANRTPYPNAHLEVVEVRFADGTVWHRS
jgi:hypothetical protein